MEHPAESGLAIRRLVPKHEGGDKRWCIDAVDAQITWWIAGVAIVVASLWPEAEAHVKFAEVERRTMLRVTDVIRYTHSTAYNMDG